ncbi:MarR family winged helix-turn-helix transcriptional regulator [Moorella sp. Hama-1]|uniref:MarR family winged helix-turn-helix transcriptional regulator n=1 Tax=Moorella sp. Hama-1 TaxID=2138101 RepID=UPI001F44BCAE|nr:MarR family winged helix-turn-helix transcriptional regulator [Moorella sp. Hama-1]MDN5361864.1 MarR family transcriptional regulator, organic hydroperoxide resistance regulator [Moorella sp. (in: firmicutes)]BCV21066.1 MarR family transcriptional regulator [Moorella sp. Hama-1]
MDGPVEAIRELEYLLRQINHLMNHYTRSYLNDRGLTMARFWVLSNLSRGQKLTMGDLQRRLLLAPGTVTGLVDGLAAEGLVRRWRDENDRRLVFLDLTAAGEEFLEGILNFRSDVLAKAMSGPGETNSLDTGQLNADLRVILANLRSLCKGERERDAGSNKGKL